MHTRVFGRTGWQVSEIGFGAWGIGGGQWGGADEAESMATLHAALDSGIAFFDTADVYGDGLSERLIGRIHRERQEPFGIATFQSPEAESLEGAKMGRTPTFARLPLANPRSDALRHRHEPHNRHHAQGTAHDGFPTRK